MSGIAIFVVMNNYDEDTVAEAVSAIDKIVTILVPDAPAIQIETILLGAVSFAIHTLGMPREDAYSALSRLLEDLRDRGRKPLLSLVP